MKIITSILNILSKKKGHYASMISAISLTSASIVTLVSILRIQENPNRIFKELDRTVIINRSERYLDGETWTRGLNYRLIKEIEKSPYVENASIYTRSSKTNIWVGENRIEANLLASDHRFASLMNLEFVDGSFFSEDEFNKEALVCVISEKLSRECFPGISALNQTIEVQGFTLRIIAVMKRIPAISAMGFDEGVDILMPLSIDSDKNREFDLSEISYSYSVNLILNDKKNKEAFYNDIDKTCSSFEVKPEKFALTVYPFTMHERIFEKINSKRPNNADILNEENWNFLLRSGHFILILSIISFLNTTQLNLSGLLNRSTEIGIRYAFGANRYDLLKQSVVEASIVSILSIMLATLISQLFFFILEKVDYLKSTCFNFDQISILILIVYCLLFPLLSSLFTFESMAKKKPISLLKGANL